MRPTGVTVIETRLGAVTVREVDPEIPPNEAEIVVEPEAIPFTTPAALTVAMLVEEDPHVTSDVRSALLPSL